MTEVKNNAPLISRRNLLSAAGALAATSAAGVSLAAPASLHGHAVAKSEKLAKAARHCVESGRSGLEHCLAQLKSGDASLTGCAARVQDMVLSCGTLSRLALNGSRHLSLIASATKEICSDCEQACRRHARHAPLLRCAEACAALSEQCEAFVV